MIATVCQVLAQEAPAVDDAHDDAFAKLDVAEGLVRAIPRCRIEQAVRLLARRIVDWPTAEAAAAMPGGR